MSSSNINSVVVNGRLTHHPKLHETSGENVYTLLRLAITRRIGEDRKQTIYYDVKAWNGSARACVEHLRKGALVSVQGRLDQYDKPETKESREKGVKERWNFITAERVEFCSRPKGQEGAEDEEAGDE